MSKKVKLSQAQADAVEYFERVFVKNKATSMSNETLRKALFIGYEVEPEYSAGDWIYVEDKMFPPRFHQIKEVEEDRLGLGNATFINLASKNFRHATPEEIEAEKDRRRIDEEMDNLLLSLTNRKRAVLHDKLNCADGDTNENLPN